MSIQLGIIAKDTITGFTGKVTAICRYITGKDRCGVSALNSKGEPVEEWFDIERLKEVE
jgi:hypothetical protein